MSEPKKLTAHPDAPLSEAEEKLIEDFKRRIADSCNEDWEALGTHLRALVRDVRRERDEPKCSVCGNAQSHCAAVAHEQAETITRLGTQPTPKGLDYIHAACHMEIRRLRAQVEEGERIHHLRTTERNGLIDTLRAQVESLTRQVTALKTGDLSAIWDRAASDGFRAGRAESDVQRDALRAEVARLKEYGHDYISRTDPLLSCGYHEADAGTPGEPCGSCRMCALEDRNALRSEVARLTNRMRGTAEAPEPSE